MFVKAQIPAAIAAALLVSAPVFAGQIDSEAVPVPGAATTQAQPPLIDMSGVETDKAAILSSRESKINGAIELTGYTVMLRSGDSLPLLDGEGVVSYGTIYDILGNPILEGGTPKVSNDNDFNSLITGEDGNLYLISHFESRPGAIYQTAITQESNGTLTPTATRHIDFSAYQGDWVHCAGSVTLGVLIWVQKSMSRMPASGAAKPAATTAPLAASAPAAMNPPWCVIWSTAPNSSTRVPATMPPRT